jgi:hypothetical protein
MGREHHQPVEAERAAGRGRHVGERGEEVLVERIAGRRRGVPSGPCRPRTARAVRPGRSVPRRRWPVPPRRRKARNVRQGAGLRAAGGRGPPRGRGRRRGSRGRGRVPVPRGSVSAREKRSDQLSSEAVGIPAAGSCAASADVSGAPPDRVARRSMPWRANSVATLVRRSGAKGSQERSRWRNSVTSAASAARQDGGAIVHQRLVALVRAVPFQHGELGGGAARPRGFARRGRR